MGDRSKAITAADKVSQILPVRGMLNCLLPPTADVPEHASRERRGVYLALGGPGVGKTSGRVVECIQDVCVNGHKRVLLVCSLCQVRNMHVGMLQSSLAPDVFAEQVRVIGSRGLDELARSRTLPALVWRRMEAIVSLYERRLSLLHDAATRVSALGVFLRWLKTNAAYFRGDRPMENVIELINSFGVFKETLATMHKVVASDRHAVETYVSTVQKDIIASTRVLVSTVGSLLRKSALREVGGDVDPFSFRRVGNTSTFEGSASESNAASHKYCAHD